MSIIYSYPTSQPTVDDLLIGTDVNDDNATKSFTVQSLVSLINAAAGSGTVTSVQIATDYSLSATGGPIVDSGVITMGLATTGVPDTTKFLGYSAAGQLEWRLPTVTSGIIVSNNSSIITGTPTTGDPLASLNFTGEGVDATSDSLGNVQVSIPGATNAIEKIVPGTGITVSSPTGNVTISNSGILSITQGDGITATTTEGVTTISAVSQASGTVTSVTPGPGLRLLSESTSTASPIIGLNYGNTPGSLADNYINQQDGLIVNSESIIPHYTSSSGDNTVYQTTLGNIPLTALTNINNAITDSAANVIKNDTDVSPFLEAVPRVDKVVTLTDAQYQTLKTTSPLPVEFGNTLYLTTAAGATPVTQYDLTNNISVNITLNGSPFTEYQLISSPANGEVVTAASGTTQNWTTAIALTNSSYVFNSGPTISPASPQSVLWDANKTINTQVTGTVALATVQQCTAYLGGLDPNNAGNGIGAFVGSKSVNYSEEGVDYRITYTNSTNSLSGACTNGFTPSQSNFGVAFALIGPSDPGYVVGRGTDKYSIESGPTYDYSGATTFNGTNPTCNIIVQVKPRQYSVDFNIINNIDGDGSLMGTNYNLQNGPEIYTNENQLNPPQSLLTYGWPQDSSTVAIGTDVNAVTGINLSNIVKTPSGPDVNLWNGDRFIIPNPPGVNKNYDFTITLTGSSGASNFLITAGTQTVNVGLNGDYAFQYNLNNANAWTEYTAPFSVPAGTVVAFAYTVLPANGYFFLNAPVLSYNGSPVATGDSTGLTRRIFDSFTATVDTTRGPASVTATTSAFWPSTLVSSGGQQSTQCTSGRFNKVYIRKGAGNTEPLVVQQNDFLYTNEDSANPIPINWYSGYGPEEVEFAVDNQGKIGQLLPCGGPAVAL